MLRIWTPCVAYKGWQAFQQMDRGLFLAHSFGRESKYVGKRPFPNIAQMLSTLHKPCANLAVSLVQTLRQKKKKLSTCVVDLCSTDG